MKTQAFFTAAALLLALPLAAQTADATKTRDQTRTQDQTQTRDQVRKQDGTGTGTPTQSRLRKRDGSCGNPNPAGCRGAAQQGARRGQGRR